VKPVWYVQIKLKIRKSVEKEFMSFLKSFQNAISDSVIIASHIKSRGCTMRNLAITMDTESSASLFKGFTAGRKVSHQSDSSASGDMEHCVSSYLP
jgi:hypothetical protein